MEQTRQAQQQTQQMFPSFNLVLFTENGEFWLGEFTDLSTAFKTVEKILLTDTGNTWTTQH